MKEYFVYILTNASGTLYTGMTNNLERRMREHKLGEVPGFARRFRLARLVYFEKTGEVKPTIAREKQIKGWLRKRKIELIESVNPDWRDLSEDWF